ncbi:hypothetical protein ACOMHN_036868 [Nucella lapillus]
MERQPLLGEGAVTLEVSNPREQKRESRYKRSEVTSLHHSYPLRLLVPEHASATACRWIYPLTFGGGLVGGDVISIDYDVGTNCSALVTSQESTKVYHCREGQVSEQTMTYHVGDRAFLAVLGDPVVCFADAHFKQTQRVEMSDTGSVVLLDWMTAGRVALAELWQFKSYQSVIEVYLGEDLVLRDNQHLVDTPCQTVRQAMKDYQVMGTCVILGTDMQPLVTHLKQLYGRPQTIGQQLSTEVVCSFSPLEVESGKTALDGCYLRFLATSTTLAYGVVKEITSVVTDLLGGDPYARKY